MGGRNVYVVSGTRLKTALDTNCMHSFVSGDLLAANLSIFWWGAGSLLILNQLQGVGLATPAWYWTVPSANQHSRCLGWLWDRLAFASGVLFRAHPDVFLKWALKLVEMFITLAAHSRCALPGGR